MGRMATATRTDAPTKLGYQPALDGLRALSVMAVILYHADVSWMPGGFLGVEVFFVVSGFLITSLLLEERARNGVVDLRHFWIRRGRRLLPALYLLLAVVSVASLLVYQDAAGRMGGDVLAAIAVRVQLVADLPGPVVLRPGRAAAAAPAPVVARGGGAVLPDLPADLRAAA